MMSPTPEGHTEQLLRELTPQVLGALIRRFGDFGSCEDALQEALIAATAQWPRDGVPDNPRGWLARVASRRITDQVRAEAARRRREQLVVSLIPPEEQIALTPDPDDPTGADDSLVLLFMCCHPALSSASAIALTLRAVGGLTTAAIARAFLVPEATMAQRISRAKRTIAQSGVPFALPVADQWADRLAAVLHVLYLIFNEGYATSSGDEVYRTDLSGEAIRLARILHQLLPDHAETAGLLALMLLTDARRAARSGPGGELIPLDEQDRSLWDRAAIDEGITLISATLAHGAVGMYQLQAAIAALHDEAPTTAETDWPQIMALYDLLGRMTDNPMVRLNHAIAVAMVHGPAVGLERLEALAHDPRLAGHYRLEAVRGHLLERAGDDLGAAACYRRAAAATASTAERDFLLTRAARLATTSR